MLAFDLLKDTKYPMIRLTYFEACGGKTFPDVGDIILLSGKEVQITKIFPMPVTSLSLDAAIEWEESQ